MRKRARENYVATQEDIRMRRELSLALMQVQSLPPQDQWGMVLDILPDAFYCYVLQTRIVPEPIKGERLIPLAAIAVSAIYGGELEPRLIALAVKGVFVSALVELERRQGHFCSHVGRIDNIFLAEAVEDILLTPKDPDTFTLEALIAHYAEVCGSAS